MVKLPDITIDLNEINQSELVALCKWVGVPASRGWPRDLLIEALECFSPQDIPDPLDLYRDKVSGLLNRYWERIKMQVQKKVCPNCENCRDLQVLACFNKNRHHIEGRRK